MGGRQNQYRVTHFKQEKWYGKAPSWQILFYFFFISFDFFLFMGSYSRSFFCFPFYFALCTVLVFVICLWSIAHTTKTDNTRFITIFTNSFKKRMYAAICRYF